MTDTSLLPLYGNCIIFGWSYIFIVSLVTLVCWNCIMEGRIMKSQTTREQARETGPLVKEAEQRIDAEPFPQ